MGLRRFTRLTNGFSKKLANHRAAIALHIGFYNLCRTHETLRCTPAMALGVTDHIWTIGELVDAALNPPTVPPLPTPGQQSFDGLSAARAKGDPFGGKTMRRPRLRVIRGGAQ
jgi:hypothetical protein